MNYLRKSLGKILICVVVILAFNCSNIYAASAPLNRTKAFSHLKKAYNAQLSLGQTSRSQANIKKILAPYFTTKYIDFFIKECMVKDGQGWYVPASDVMDGFIPFFSYNSKTKVTYSKDKKTTYVYERFPANDKGPVAWEAHTEKVTILKTKPGWRVNAIEWLR